MGKQLSLIILLLVLKLINIECFIGINLYLCNKIE
jgi:hypothetical protein